MTCAVAASSVARQACRLRELRYSPLQVCRSQKSRGTTASTAPPASAAFRAGSSRKASSNRGRGRDTACAVRCTLRADVVRPPRQVRFVPNCGHSRALSGLRNVARSRYYHESACDPFGRLCIGNQSHSANSRIQRLDLPAAALPRTSRTVGKENHHEQNELRRSLRNALRRPRAYLAGRHRCLGRRWATMSLPRQPKRTRAGLRIRRHQWGLFPEKARLACAISFPRHRGR